MPKYRFIILKLFMCLIASPAIAQQDVKDITLEDILDVEVTTATRKAQKLEMAPGSISVITRKQIQETNARTLRDVLNVFVPGMDVVPTYFRYGDRVSEGVYSRGILSDFSQQVLFLLNGQGKFNDSTFSSAYPAIEFTLENVERVEVSRTPIPIYGGSAITVINIITREQFIKSGAEFFVDISAQEDASLRTRPVSGRRISGNFGSDINDEWHLSGSVQTYSEAGQAHSDRAGTNGYAGNLDQLRDGTKSAINSSLVLQSKDKKWFTQMNYKEINKDAFLSGQVPSQSADAYNYRGAHFILNTKYKMRENWDFMAGYSRMLFENIVAPPAGGRIINYDMYAETTYNLQMGQNSLLTGFKIENEGQNDGAGYSYNSTTGNWTEDRRESALFAPNTNRTVTSFYGENTLQASDDLSVVAGARVDHYNGHAGKSYTLINPRLATALKLSNSMTGKLTYASASRPPSIYEKLGTLLAPLAGDVDVKTETVQTLEASLGMRSGNMKFEVTPFYQIFDNKIEFIDDGTGTLRAKNNDSATIAGIELDGQYVIGKSNIFANATYLESKDGGRRDMDTLFIPKYYFNAGTNMFVTDKLNLNLTGFYRGHRPLGGQYPTSQNIVNENINANLSANYLVSNRLTVYGLIENLSDQKNFLPNAKDGVVIPLRDRTYHVGLKMNL